MNSLIKQFKGLHPGIVVERELKKRSLKQRPFALSIEEYPQTFNAVLKARRRMPVSLALKIEKKLELEEGTLALLQTYHDIKKEKEKIKGPTPDLSVLRKGLFWDTSIDRIDWERQYRAVIQRIFERGNAQEKKEIIRFYGKEKVDSVLLEIPKRPLPRSHNQSA